MKTARIGDEDVEIPLTYLKLQCLHCEDSNLRIVEGTFFRGIDDDDCMNVWFERIKSGGTWSFECSCRACGGVTEISLHSEEVDYSKSINCEAAKLGKQRSVTLRI